MWEDNLPQIAIEMVAMGVPVLCSSFGGASELCHSDRFIFQGGDEKDFRNKLIYFVENPERIKEFWNYHNGLLTMKEHFENLSEIYGLPEKPEGKVSLEDYALLLEENEFLYRNFGNNNSISKHSDPERQNELFVRQNEQLVSKEQEIRRLKEERDYLQYSIDETRKSFTYKIGRAVTLVPRKLRGEK